MSKPWKVIAVTWSEEGNACLEIEGLTRVGIAEARIVEASKDLLQELRNIANADYRHWEGGHNTAEDFVLWAKIRARHAISKAEELKP